MMRFLCQLGSISPPQFQHIFEKTIPRAIKNFDPFSSPFFFHFSSVLGAKLELCWPPLWTQDAPKTAQDASRTATRSSSRLQDTSRRPKTNFLGCFGRIMIIWAARSGGVLGRVAATRPGSRLPIDQLEEKSQESN